MVCVSVAMATQQQLAWASYQYKYALEEMFVRICQAIFPPGFTQKV